MESFEEWAKGRLYSYSGCRFPLKGNDVKVYEVDELKPLYPLFQQLEVKWFCLARNHKDYRCGSCVVGDGFFVLLRPKRKRAAYPFRILVTGSQMGSLAWEDTKDIIEEDLKTLGIEAFYRWGNLD